MTLYWSTKQIPELKGLEAKDQMVLTRPVLGAVWRRWQVWLPVVTQIVLVFSFIFLGPQFPYRTAFVIVMAFATVKLAFLPYNHFLALELRLVGGDRR